MSTYFEKGDVYLPGTFLAFPVLIERVPLWLLFGPLGLLLAHELAHVFQLAGQEYTNMQTPSPFGIEEWYNVAYVVRSCFQKTRPHVQIIFENFPSALESSARCHRAYESL